MSKQTEKQIFEKTFDVVQNAGYELCDVNFVGRGDNLELVFVIDKQGGVSLDDCEKVHYLVEPIVDELNPTDDAPYSLSISSLGLLRPMKTTRDFERKLGEEVEVKLFAPFENKKIYSGVLKSVNEETITLDDNGKEIVLARNTIANAVLKLDF